MTKYQAMTEGGKRLGHIKGLLAGMVKEGVTPLEIDAQAEKLIKEGDDRPNFKMEPGYHHSTCINVNQGIVNGIPGKIPFKAGDVVKIDMGLFHEGYHLDTSITIAIPPISLQVAKFLEVCQKALDAAIFEAIPGHTVYDIGLAMQTVVETAGYNVIRDLTGHGIGRKLHMEPYIPCFADNRSKKFVLSVDQTVAIEAMVAMGDWHLVEESDGWTLSTQDRSLTAMIEETVYITPEGPKILTGIN
ncbi:type I methionyl aminopeptidase [Candidatus Collierbacteria bacterium CG_4_10_14_0_8_um_filter_43_86]|nr:MAG: type I methionyl aminopeptidase [Candidatus Collierbacteria bacterium CG_4_10_14_0_8_um_filter_43_86]